MTKIALVRHGETEYNRQRLIQGQIDIPLNEVGKNQAKLTAKNFTKVDVIISSPLSRAKETAKIIAQEINHQQEIIINDYFIERDFGLADGKDISKWFDKIHAQSIKNLELSSDLKKRTMIGLKNVVKEYQNKNIMIVSHSHTIKAILNAIDPQKYNFYTNLSNCGITILEYENNQFKIIRTSYNDYID